VKARPEERIALERRAERVARLRHPNLARMLPVPGGAGFVPVLRQGRRLSELTFDRSFRPFELEQVVRFLLDVLSGLSALHEVAADANAPGRVFVHGEVSPQHIYVGEDGVARLVPLLSRHLRSDVTPASNGYGAPELLLREGPDQRADLFSVGVMLWEALSGEVLFPDPTASGVTKQLERRQETVPRTPPDLAWAAPLGVVAGRAVSLHPVLRFQTAIEFSNALGAALAAALERRVDQMTVTRMGSDEPTAAHVPRPRGTGQRSITPAGVVLDVRVEPPVESTSPVAPSKRARLRGKLAGVGAFTLAGAAAAALIVMATGSRPGRPGSAPPSEPESAAHSLAGVALGRAAAAASASAPQPAPVSSASVEPAVQRAPPRPARREDGPRRPRLGKPDARDYGI
jgi:eukaryotic-like serine/threonine-protein kinase